MPLLNFPTRYACPACGRKMLSHPNHHSAIGYKDYGKVKCRRCGKVFDALKLKDWIEKKEKAGEIVDGRFNTPNPEDR